MVFHMVLGIPPRTCTPGHLPPGQISPRQIPPGQIPPAQIWLTKHFKLIIYFVVNKYFIYIVILSIPIVLPLP